MKKKFAMLALSGLLTISTFSSAFAGSWMQDNVGWWYLNDDGGYPANGWHWIDGNNDNTAECYYFNESGYCLLNTTTPDGYTVDANGAWIVSGIVQTKTASVTLTDSETTSTSSSTASSESIESNWNGKMPYVSGMVKDMPTSGSFWTVNISTGKYHITPNVDGLLPSNTVYYSGNADVLEANGYSRCRKNGCY